MDKKYTPNLLDYATKKPITQTLEVASNASAWLSYFASTSNNQEINDTTILIFLWVTIKSYHEQKAHTKRNHEAPNWSLHNQPV